MKRLGRPEINSEMVGDLRTLREWGVRLSMLLHDPLGDPWNTSYSANYADLWDMRQHVTDDGFLVLSMTVRKIPPGR